VRVVHDGPQDTAKQLTATYITGDKAYKVKGRKCIMAGYNAMIPHICPELPKPQSEALSGAIKAPIIYTSVLLNNWRAWKALGVGFFASPGSYYAVSMLDFPISMGGYQYTSNPGEPVIAHMERFFIGDDHDALPREQLLAGRREMYATSFESIERATREQLAGALSEGGFDPAEDIAGITVNRWGHGYAYGPHPTLDTVDGEPINAHVTGRQPFGRIAVANSDAGASASINAAISQASRAVSEVIT
jgi:spermidine dehydrogenase